MDDVYDLFTRGTALLEAGHNHQAVIPLSRARDLDPDKTSIREALGRALFGARDYEQAASEFEAVLDRPSTNDFALFCLGRSLQMLGRHAEVSGSTLRLFIDHPDGVTLAVCERVSGRLSDYRDRYALEVSSPGQDRPLTKPQHYTRFLGRRARVRLRDGAHTDHKSFTGELVGASDEDV